MPNITKRRARRVAPHEVEESVSIMESAGMCEMLPDNAKARVRMTALDSLSFAEAGAEVFEGLSADDVARATAGI